MILPSSSIVHSVVSVSVKLTGGFTLLEDSIPWTWFLLPMDPILSDLIG
jgi:hypothetical protein